MKKMAQKGSTLVRVLSPPCVCSELRQSSCLIPYQAAVDLHAIKPESKQRGLHDTHGQHTMLGLLCPIACSKQQHLVHFSYSDTKGWSLLLVLIQQKRKLVQRVDELPAPSQ